MHSFKSNSLQQNSKEQQIKVLHSDLVMAAIKPAPLELLTESQTSKSGGSDKVIMERILPQHPDFKLLKQIFKISHAKVLHVYKKNDP